MRARHHSPFLLLFLLLCFCFFPVVSAFAQPNGGARVQVLLDDDDATSSTLDSIERQFTSFSGENPILGVIAKILFTPFVNVDGQEITLFKLIIAALFLVLGLMAARRLTDMAKSRLLMRFRIAGTSLDFMTRVIYFTLVAFVAIFVMDFAGIPLSVFAFLGGAIAIAVGFGAQELLANFIGGLILVFERPIRKGDLLEFEGEKGMVEEIGARFTRLSMPGRSDLLVPNRMLLESIIVNLTLTDPFVRTEVCIGVAYGSDVRLVERLLREAVEEHSQVQLKEMKPVVLFEDFGDNALAFRVMFVVRVKSFLDQRMIQSDLRFRIDELFREHNISISFPQRDVHLDTLKPLEVVVRTRLERETDPDSPPQTL